MNTKAFSLPVITLVASVLTPGAVGAGIVYWLNHEYTPKVEGGYLTIREFRISGAESTAQRLQEEVDSLQYDADHGQASEKDLWLLEQKKKQLEQWQDKISKLKENRPVV